MARPATLRNVAGDIFETTPVTAFRANTGRNGGRNEKSAFGTIPVCQSALRAYISYKFPVSGIATVSACPRFLIAFHLIPSEYQTEIQDASNHDAVTKALPH